MGLGLMGNQRDTTPFFGVSNLKKDTQMGNHVSCLGAPASNPGLERQRQLHPLKSSYDASVRTSLSTGSMAVTGEYVSRTDDFERAA